MLTYLHEQNKAVSTNCRPASLLSAVRRRVINSCAHSFVGFTLQSSPNLQCSRSCPVHSAIPTISYIPIRANKLLFFVLSLVTTALTAQTAIMGLSVSLCYSSRYNDTLSSSKFHILSLVIAARLKCKKKQKAIPFKGASNRLPTPYHHPITLPNNIIQSIYTA